MATWSIAMADDTKKVSGDRIQAEHREARWLVRIYTGATQTAAFYDVRAWWEE